MVTNGLEEYAYAEAWDRFKYAQEWCRIFVIDACLRRISCLDLKRRLQPCRGFRPSQRGATPFETAPRSMYPRRDRSRGQRLGRDWWQNAMGGEGGGSRVERSSWLLFFLKASGRRIGYEARAKGRRPRAYLENNQLVAADIEWHLGLGATRIVRELVWWRRSNAKARVLIT